MNKSILTTAVIAVFLSALTFYGLDYLNSDAEPETVKIEHIDSQPVKGAMYSVDENGEVVPLDFQNTAAKVMESVVYIKSTIKRDQTSRQQQIDPFRRFFEREGSPFEDMFPQEPQYGVGSGSGVIINDKGYIVTNNHVIDKATDIEVTLNDNRSMKAKVVGTDPNTDLALLQVKADDLKALPLVNSDDVNIGEWVMAVGNPFNLTSTVTAGIVSAKARNININSNRFAIESFIQTDAVINRGNSGGALVNLDGSLVGIPTAMMSPTGTYSGYGFAIPSNIVSKVVEDLLEYGTVRRGYLGVMIRDLNSNLAAENNIDINDGVYIDSVMAGSAAATAGLQSGDVVVSVEGRDIKTTPELQARIAQQRPGDKVKLTVLRDNRKKQFEVVLKNQYGKEEVVVQSGKMQKLGIQASDLTEEQKQEYGIEGGVYVEEIGSGIIARTTNMKDGFIITELNDRPVRNTEEFKVLLEKLQGGALVKGFYEELPGVYYYGFGVEG